MRQPELGKKIIELRKERGFTQEELVELCNINVRTIQRIESGEVTPRPYTVKTILSVLGHDLDSIKEDDEHHYSQMQLSDSTLKSTKNYLVAACVFGVIYFLLGFVELYMDWYRWFDNYMVVSNLAYNVTKVLIVICYTVFMLGFVKLGSVFNNPFIKFAVFGFIICTLALYGYQIASLYDEPIPMEYAIGSFVFISGILNLIFAAGLYKLQKPLGNSVIAVVIIEALFGLLCITILLAIVAQFLYPLVILAELLILYKALTFMKTLNTETT